MSGQEQQIFVDQLAHFAAGAEDGRVTAVVERVAAPLRVAVRGRRGVGSRTVARALDRAGMASGIVVTADGDLNRDVVVYVTAEVVKPEDIEAIAATRCPVLAVLNKADLAGSLSGRTGNGPMAAAVARCAELSALAGVPMEPMIGLLAVAALDDPDQLDQQVWAPLRVLATHRGGSASLGFLAPDDPDNPVPNEVRQRLLDGLDVFGTAVAVAAVRRGATDPQVRTLLRRVSGVDAVVDKIRAAGAEARYRRALEAVAELEALAVTDEGIGERITEFLSRDDTVIARMAAAADLAEAAGLEGGPARLDRDDPAAHLSQAARWQRYSRGPVHDLHRNCGADIARGSLRLWAQTCRSLPGEPGGVQ